jgi:hypothetical protein
MQAPSAALLTVTNGADAVWPALQCLTAFQEAIGQNKVQCSLCADTLKPVTADGGITASIYRVLPETSSCLGVIIEQIKSKAIPITGRCGIGRGRGDGN